jgi:membrane carboxypeptidase/penicillin-binding protein PbpC
VICQIIKERLERRAADPSNNGQHRSLARQGRAPQIIASASGATRDILFGSSAAIPLRAKTDADVREVYWFANKTFIGKGGATEVIAWKSSPGRYELCALDDHGRSGSCTATKKSRFRLRQ